MFRVSMVLSVRVYHSVLQQAEASRGQLYSPSGGHHPSLATTTGGGVLRVTFQDFVHAVEHLVL